MPKFLTIVFLSQLACTSFAMVDSSTGAFTHSWIDYEGKGLDLKLKLERTYNSRSNHVGWFGHGWCSDLETNIIASETTVSAIHCGDGQETVFKKSGSLYKSSFLAAGIFRKVSSGWIRTLPDGTQESFSLSGRLQEVKKGQDYLALKYSEKGHLKEVIDSGGRHVQVITSPTGLITEINFLSKNKKGISFKETIAKYTYNGTDLISALNSWENLYSYEYDKDHNMIKAVWPEKKTVNISYNSNDWVKSVSGSGICDEQYDYKIDSINQPPKYAVSVRKLCPNDVIIERAYSYSYSLDNKRLVAAELDENGVQRTFKYDDLGNVIAVIERRPRGDITSNITRNANGHIIQISNLFETRKYAYKRGHSRDLVVEASFEDVVMGKVIQTTIYRYAYDENDRMVSVILPNNDRLFAKYNDFDRVEKIALKDLEIEVVYEHPDDVKGIRYNGKVLPLEIYDKKFSPKEISAVELYFSFVRGEKLAVPYY
ncbi:MAG: hypothetical protein OM95_07965 [Bdellovibrio sp. ArHS]|uniref:DUF6531 domain-containing protein n=1 Tax=Bdellovibrio sp. ArHS TaxID=1569284 RepID=UPI000583B4BA|nr:DUF6531 domain-containing protein [Bdellovibrio sp. ArHS]KHD88721.1 MAG: hypothetical protein OM95_07965 [Bdellovibrio sp. ArHS]